MEEPTGAKLHRQFHARKQQLHAFLWAVLVLVSLSWLITLSNNGTLVARQKLEGKALDSFPPSEGEPVRSASSGLLSQSFYPFASPD